MNRFLRTSLALVLAAGLVASLSAQDRGEVVSIPGFGDVGIKQSGKTYTVALADWGTWDFTGTYKNKSDFDLAAKLPVGAFTDYVPGVGQILGLMGLDSVGLRVTPKGVGLSINLEGGGLGALRGAVTEALAELPGAGVVVDTMISVLEIKKFTLEGSIIKKVFEGKVEGSVSLAGADFSFREEGAVSWKTVKKSITKAGSKVVNDYVVKYSKMAFTKSKEVALKYGTRSLNAVNQTWDAAARYAREAAKTINYATNTYDKNLNSDLPRYIEAKANPMLEESIKSIDALFRDVLPVVRNMNTKEEKDALIHEAFTAFNAEYDRRWQALKDEDDVKAWSTLSKRENELMRRWQEGIQAKWDLVKARRGELYQQLIAAKPMYRIPRTADDSLRTLAAYARSKTPVIIETKMELMALDVYMGEGGKNGTKVTFYHTHAQPNQQWILVPAGAPNQYHFRNVATGRFIHIAGGADKDARGSRLVVWDGAGAQYRQTVFTAFATPDGYVHFKTDKGYALDLAGGVPVASGDLQLWDNHQGDAQAFYVYEAPEVAKK